MKIENQVCTLEQAKRLKELGVMQCGYFLWSKTGELKPDDYNNWDPVDPASSFTVAELGAMLPGKFQYKDEECFVDSTKYCTDITWLAGIHTTWAHEKPVVAKKYFSGQTEAQVRATMLIYLLEKKVITAEEVNKRLEA
ncbi:hypothetical protein [Paraflavitalea sp. CAU 1676]|uniref:hypothetical protein n=1 Tax=Paraflavitalea sp. CAU 1676 TaxID=3032598 RepID=UPI0023DAF37A|nr:hypothetical protein [Paraflavitalea sp. CAU 1676]MDF2189306.1 hypothetical protein [Paraflavitalea sp. CAU 1676]